MLIFLAIALCGHPKEAQPWPARQACRSVGALQEAFQKFAEEAGTLAQARRSNRWRLDPFQWHRVKIEGTQSLAVVLFGVSFFKHPPPYLLVWIGGLNLDLNILFLWSSNLTALPDLSNGCMAPKQPEGRQLTGHWTIVVSLLWTKSVRTVKKPWSSNSSPQHK